MSLGGLRHSQLETNRLDHITLNKVCRYNLSKSFCLFRSVRMMSELENTLKSNDATRVKTNPFPSKANRIQNLGQKPHAEQGWADTRIFSSLAVAGLCVTIGR